MGKIIYNIINNQFTLKIVLYNSPSHQVIIFFAESWVSKKKAYTYSIDRF